MIAEKINPLNEHKSFFGGTAYLAIPFNEKFKQLVLEGIDRYGINYGASRNNNVTLDVFGLAETEAAIRHGAEDAVIVSSGYLAAQLVVQNYLGKCKFIYAPDTHPALWIGNPQPPKVSFTEWSEHTVDEINRSENPVLLITNSLNNLFPEIYDFDWLKRIRPDRKVSLLVDDSHGIGITGESGEGVYSRLPKLPNIDVIVIASMAKALGIDAGLILGTRQIIDQLRDSPIYAGASPPSPGLLSAYINAFSIYQEELERLRANMKFFFTFIENDAGISFLQDFPVYVINKPEAVRLIAESGTLISSFSYPDPKGMILNRVVLNSRHTKAEIRAVAEAIKVSVKIS